VAGRIKKRKKSKWGLKVLLAKVNKPWKNGRICVDLPEGVELPPYYGEVHLKDGTIVLFPSGSKETREELEDTVGNMRRGKVQLRLK